MIKITVEIEGMKCPMCEKHTNDAIKEALDVKSVSSSHKEHIPLAHSGHLIPGGIFHI